jgi:hypothetical protein
VVVVSWLQWWQQQHSSHDDNIAIIGIGSLVLGLTQQSTNYRGKRMGKMRVNDGDEGHAGGDEHNDDYCGKTIAAASKQQST